VCPIGTKKLDCGNRRSLKRQNRHFRRKKRDKSPAKPRLKTASRFCVGSCPSRFSVTLQSGFAIDWRSEKRGNQATLPELGDEVSGLVEKLSRKIHIETTKSYACGVESVYL
jgi:hypothetical protein